MEMKYGYIAKILYFRELLRQIKRLYRWDYISSRTGIAPSTLSRYLHGRIIPNPDRVDNLINLLETLLNIEELIRDSLMIDKYGYLNNQKIITDIGFLKFIALKTSWRYQGKLDLVLSPATDGVPYATLVAEYLGTPMVIAKDRKEVGVHKHLEASVISDDGSVRTLYVAKGPLKKGYRVLIVDDVIRTGETHRGLIELIKKAGAIPLGIHVIIAIGSKWRYLEDKYNIPIEAVVRLGERLRQG